MRALVWILAAVLAPIAFADDPPFDDALLDKRAVATPFGRVSLARQ